jgi:5'-nucleotidase/UDP-sugar diphosphatase
MCRGNGQEMERGKRNKHRPRFLEKRHIFLLFLAIALLILRIIPEYLNFLSWPNRIKRQAVGKEDKLRLWHYFRDRAEESRYSWFNESSRWRGCSTTNENLLSSDNQSTRCSLRVGGLNTTTTQSPARPGLRSFNLSSSPSDGAHAVILMFTSDLHGHVRRICRGASCYPGAASVASVVRTVRSAAKVPVLLIDAGDALFGSANANETIVGDVMNLLGYDAMVLGNHDFDVGSQRLEGFANRTQFPILAANIEGPSFVQKYLRVDLGGGISLCIVGVSTAEANPLTGDKVSIRPEESVVEYVTTLRTDEICKHTIVISHGGILVDQQIARKGRAVIDAVIGGHSHVVTGVPSDAMPESVEFGEVQNRPFPFRVEATDAPIAHVGSYGRYMGLLQLEWLGSKLTKIEGSLVPLDTRHGVVPDKDVDQWLADHLSSENSSIPAGGHGVRIEIDDTLGKNDGCGFVCRRKECALGNLMTDAMRSCVLDGACSSFVPQSSKGRSIVAVLESGSLRDCVSTDGDEDFGSVLPWPNNLVLLTVSGGILREMLEHGVKSRGEGKGGFLQTSGLSYRYRQASVTNVSVPVGAQKKIMQEHQVDGGRVTMSQISNRCKAQKIEASELIQNNTLYLVVVTDWLAAGGDGFGDLVALAHSSIKTNVTLRETLLLHTTTSPKVQREGRSCFIPSGSSASTSNALSGMVGGYIAFFAAYPLDTLFVRKSGSSTEELSRRGLFDGVWLGSLATASCQFIYFLIYHSESLLLYSPFVRSTLGAVSTVIVSNPQWVVVTRMQTSESKLSLRRAIGIVHKERGWIGFFAGVSMNLVMCVFPIVRQVTMESILEFVGGSLKSPISVAIAAAIAACVATFVTLPIQRWRVQLQQGVSYKDITICAHCCDGLAFKMLHSCISSFVLFIVKGHLDDLVLMAFGD